jgi:hypothetical protein
MKKLLIIILFLVGCGELSPPLPENTKYSLTKPFVICWIDPITENYNIDSTRCLYTFRDIHGQESKFIDWKTSYKMGDSLK